MTELNWQKIDEGVGAAAELEPTRRSAWLDDFCAGNTDLRNEIESLLGFESDAGAFLEQPISGHAAAIFDDDRNTGRVFGSYKIEREIGRGGMGAVYLASRTDGEFEQQVALKIVRGSIADSRMIERFRQERQILASLNHPNIAKLLDGGVSSSGEPFLAMEYIEGETITEFVRRTNPSINAILGLFIRVCSAVSYAHRNLVVHRDIKPGNILVTADGEPKLLDFGLAKLAENDLEDPTETIFRALTPSYASPEQFLSQPITTASDIYSLGILLFELLTGERPFNFEKKPLDQIISTISTAEPPLSSTVAGSNFNVSPQLKGDLDTIIQMSLRKEPERRYASLGEFSDDIDRHLKGIPVTARPQTARYRAGKFIRRHRLGVSAAAIILITLVAGTVFSLWQARQARLEKVKAEAVSQFLQSMLSASSPMSALKQQNNEMTVKQLLDDASSRLGGDYLDSQPEVKALLQQIIGTSYLSIGQYDPAEQNLDAAFESQKKLYGENGDETLKTLVLLAALWTERGDRDKANQFFENNLSILRNGYKSGRVTGDYLVQALNDWALLVRARGDSNGAEALMRESLLVAAQPGSGYGSALGSMQAVLALTLADQGKFTEAEMMTRQTVDSVQTRNGNDSPELASSLTGLGSFQMEQGKYTEAESNLKAAEEIYRKLFAPTFLALGDNIRLQAHNYYLQGNYTLAERRIADALKIYQDVAKNQYVNYPAALVVQGLIFTKTGRLAEAEIALREAVRIRSAILPDTHYLAALTKGALGECLTAQKKFTEAEPLLKDSLENLLATQGTENPRTALAQTRLVNLYEAWKKVDPAVNHSNQTP